MTTAASGRGKRAGGVERALETIVRVQHSQMSRMYRHIVRLAAENERLGGSEHRRVKKKTGWKLKR